MVQVFNVRAVKHGSAVSPKKTNSPIMKRTIILTLTCASLAAARAQTDPVIADWDFDLAGTQAAPYNTPSASIGTGTATQLGMNNNYTFNGGEGPGSIAWCDVLASGGASTGSGSYGWRVRGPSNSSGGGAGQSNGWNSQAPVATQGAEFFVDTSSYNNITLSVDINTTTQASRNLAILYTLDDTVASPVWINSTITSAGTLGTIVNNSSSSLTISGNYVQLGSGWNNQITASLPGVSLDPNFAVEIVNASTGADCVNLGGSPLNNSSGNWRYDNVVISGTLAVPEPGTFALASCGLAALIALRRRHA